MVALAVSVTAVMAVVAVATAMVVLEAWTEARREPRMMVAMACRRLVVARNDWACRSPRPAGGRRRHTRQ